jgi:nucleoside-diphosphate-sugar epimerase
MREQSRQMQKTRASVDSTESTVLLTGASGYVGGRLLGTLERRGMKVRCLARRPDFLRPRVSSSTEVVQGDVLTWAAWAGPRGFRATCGAARRSVGYCASPVFPR